MRKIIVALFLCLSQVVYGDGYQSYSDETFPVVPQTLTQGVEVDRDIEKRPGLQPIFVFGADRLSLQWVRTNSSYFKERHAVGFLVEADSDAHVESIREHVGYKTLFLIANDSDFASQLDLKHYPVFIDFEQGRLLR